MVIEQSETHTETTIALRGSITRNFLSFDVVAMKDPSRLTASEYIMST